MPLYEAPAIGLLPDCYETVNVGRVSGELERLSTRFERGVLVHPVSAQASVVDLAAAVWSIAGAPGILSTEAARQLEERIGQPRHLVLVIADGLGLDLLESMPAASFLWEHLAGALLTVFPSTTAVALTSIHTASWPGEHGVVGHWMLGPDRVGAITVLPFTRRGDGRSLISNGTALDDVFSCATLLDRVSRAALFVLPQRITTGGFTDYTAGSAQRAGYQSLGEGIDTVIEFVRSAEQPTCTVLYTSRVDDAAHEHGTAHLEVVGAVRALDAEVTRLARNLGTDARIVVTADHGHLPAGRLGNRVIRGDDELGKALRMPPTGDARVAYFHLDPHADPEAFASAFLDRFGEQFVLLTADEVVEGRLLGPRPPSALARARLGDFVAISLGPEVLEYRPTGGRPDGRYSFRSQHSGLTPAEMRVPFVLV